MPISIKNLLLSVDLNPINLKTVKWGQEIHSSSIGLYFITTSKDPNSCEQLFVEAPIDDFTLRYWIKKVPTIRVDNEPATVEKLRNRLSSFWLPDETILYIGQTGSKKGLQGRISQYYNTPLGERKPHAGGHWIKSLKILNDLHVHYIPLINAKETEKRLLRSFISQTSIKTRNVMFDTDLPLPFANLELEPGRRKKHGISKSMTWD